MAFNASRAPKLPSKEQIGDFFATKKGMALIAVLIVIGTYLFNTVFGDLFGMVITLVVLVAVAWGQKWYQARRTKRSL